MTPAAAHDFHINEACLAQAKDGVVKGAPPPVLSEHVCYLHTEQRGIREDGGVGREPADFLPGSVASGGLRS